jgi:5-methylthioadenosine/S-adenosylhomocysteine deaminase
MKGFNSQKARKCGSRMKDEKRKADLMIHSSTVVTFDDQDTVIADGAIVIDGNSIVWIGPTSQAGNLFQPTASIDAKGKIAMPGFIDCHLHTAQQFLRGKLAALRRRGSLRGTIWKEYLIPFESGLEPDDVYCSGLAAYSSMISCGTTCFLEAGGPHPDAMGRAADEIGIRGKIAQTTADMDDSLPRSHLFSTEEALKLNERLVRQWADHPRVNAWLSLRQIIVTSERLKIEMSGLAHDLDTAIHTHLAEGTYEVDYTIEHWGVRPAEYLERIGVLTDRLHCAHSVLLSAPELDLYAKRNISACHCSMNNYRIGSPRVLEMLRRGIRLGIGTDGAATRGTLDMFQVSHYAALGQQILAGTPYHMDSPITCEEMLRAVVRSSAKAARMEHILGSLEVGKRADLILVATDDYDQYPLMDPMIALAEHTVGRDVRTVIIDGRVIMKDREFTTLDLEPMRRKVSDRYRVIMERFDRAIA